MGELTERAVTFECEGARLVAVVAEPASPLRTGVVCVVGGPQYRVGSHRQFLLLSRALAADGYPAMRFDYRGMGDSEGAPQAFTDAPADVGAAIDALLRRCPTLERVVLWGLCDAASACLLYLHHTRDERVGGLVLVNPWIFSERHFAHSQFRRYSKRLLERDFWRGLARGELDIGKILRWAVGRVGALLRPGGRGGDEDFKDGMRAALARFEGPVLLVLSGNDLTADGFRRFCEEDSRWRAVVAGARIERLEVPAADHTFSGGAEQAALERETLAWLTRNFAAAPQDSAIPS